MATLCLIISPDKPFDSERVRRLRPTPGYCIFVDICASTEMKQKHLEQWLLQMHMCFVVGCHLLDPILPLKVVGDALMFYIEDADLLPKSPVELLEALWQLTAASGT